MNLELEWVAIIGSREPTPKQVLAVKNMVQVLDPECYAIISGCAYGIDAIALEEGQKHGIETIGVVPWRSYNTDVQKYCTEVISIEDFTIEDRANAYASVKEFHPAPDRLSQGAMKLHARNYGIVRWADMVIACPSAKAGGGGTGQGIRLANSLNLNPIIISP